jgi:hypothetical protein
MDNAETIFISAKARCNGVTGYYREIEAHEHVAIRTGGVR